MKNILRISGLVCLTLFFLCSSVALDLNPKDENIFNATLIGSHELEPDKPVSTNRSITNFLKVGDRYVLGEFHHTTYSSRLLLFDNNFKIRQNLDGEIAKALEQIGPFTNIDEDIFVQSTVLSEIILIDKSGKINMNFKSQYFSDRLLNFDILNRDSVIFCRADVERPIILFDLQNQVSRSFARKKPERLSNNQIRTRNKGYIIESQGNYIYISPYEISIEILNREMNVISHLDLGFIESLKNTIKRAEIIDNAPSKNGSLRFFNDIFKKDDKLYLLAFDDLLKSDGSFGGRKANFVIECKLANDKIQFSKIVILEKDRSYGQIIVEDSNLLAFNPKENTVDVYQID